MKRRTLIALSGASVVALMLSAAVAEAGQRAGWWGGGSVGHRAHFSRPRHGGDGPGFAHLCGSRNGERIAEMMDHLERSLDLSPEQGEAARALTEAMRTGATAFADRCGDTEQAKGPRSAPEQLAEAERMMAAGVAWMQSVRPALDRFYASLGDGQKARLDDMMARRHGGRRR